VTEVDQNWTIVECHNSTEVRCQNCDSVWKVDVPVFATLLECPLCIREEATEEKKEK